MTLYSSFVLEKDAPAHTECLHVQVYQAVVTTRSGLLIGLLSLSKYTRTRGESID